jgi:LysM repeat protein
MERRVKEIEGTKLQKTQSQLTTLEQSQRTHDGAIDQTLTRLSNIEKNLDTALRQQQSILSRMDRIEKAQLQNKQETTASLEQVRKDQTAALANATEKIRVEFNAAQKSLGKTMDQRFSEQSKSVDARIQKLSNEISSFYKDLEKTLQGYSSQGYSSGTYTVKPGDNLSKIAQSLGVSVEDLCRANNITDPSKIYVGQELALP